MRGIFRILPAFPICTFLVPPAFAEEAKAPEKVRTAFAPLWTIDDQGWTTSHYRDIQDLKERLGDEVEIAYTEKVRAADPERVFRKFAREGRDIIFGATLGRRTIPLQISVFSSKLLLYPTFPHSTEPVPKCRIEEKINQIGDGVRP
ncbi:MAG: hypothetical protein ACLFPR_06530 [Desulfococcaceae bacterium]